MDFAKAVELRVKGREKLDKWLDRVRKLNKKGSGKKDTMIPIEVGTLEQ